MAAASVCVPKGKLQLLPASPGDSPNQLRSDIGFFQMTASAPGPVASEILCEPFESEVSVSHSPLGSESNPCWPSKAKCPGGTSSWHGTPRMGSPMWGLRPLTHCGSFLMSLVVEIFSDGFQSFSLIGSL